MEIFPAAEIGEDLAAEIRIRQSVLVIRNMPVLVLGNAAGAGVVAAMDWDVFVSSYAVVPASILLGLLTPLAISYFRLRRAPRPARVGTRRIRRIEIHSLLMGLAWAAMVAMYIPTLNAANQVVVLLVSTFVWYGASAMLPSMPRTAMEYIMPTWATCGLRSPL